MTAICIKRRFMAFPPPSGPWSTVLLLCFCACFCR